MADLILFPVLGRRWWILLVRGILAIVFGLLAFTWPGLTLLILTALFAAYALVDGIFALVAGSGGCSARKVATIGAER